MAPIAIQDSQNFVISPMALPEGSTAAATDARHELYLCIELSMRRTHETAIDEPWRAFCSDAFSVEPEQITARHWRETDALVSPLREMDEQVEIARINEEQRNHIVDVATNRHTLRLSLPQRLGRKRECFVTTRKPTSVVEADVEVSLLINSLADTADYKCHRAWIAHLNGIAEAYRSRSTNSFDRVFSAVERETAAEFDALASSMSPVEAPYLPLELRDGSDAYPGVLRLDEGYRGSCFGRLFLIGAAELRQGAVLARRASVQCGERCLSFDTAVAVVT